MGRAIKSKPKLEDLFKAWWNARLELERATYRMSVTPTHIRNEKELFDIFERRMKECN